MKKSLLLLFFASALLGGGEIKILERECLAPERYSLDPGEKRDYQAKLMRTSDKPEKNVRIGLRVRAFGKQQSQDGWNRLMQLRINGRIVERFNSAEQPRLINRPEIKQPRGDKYKKYYGESWYFPYSKSWDVGFGKDFAVPPKKFDDAFEEDITDYLFDIDDLVTTDAPIFVTVYNIGSELKDIMKLIRFQNWTFPLVVGAVELVRFENPASRALGFVKLTPPGERQIGELAARLRTFPEFSEAGYRTELENLRYSESAFADCERHYQIGDTIPGHVWLEYGYHHPVEKHIPTLDMAQKAGAGVIKVHAHWASIDKEGPFRIPEAYGRKNFRNLIDECHKRGMKIIAYVSPAWVKGNRDYRKEWSFADQTTLPKPMQWGRICTGSPEWRSFFLRNVQELFDQYPVDGIYVDYGIHERLERDCTAPSHVNAFRNSKNPLAASEDMMTRLYALCRKNNKLMYLFAEELPGTEKYCDVHYVGESTPTMAAHRRRHGAFRGNIFFLPMSSFTYYSRREVYAATMALGHFPLLCAYSSTKPEETLWFRYFLPAWKAMSLPGTHVYRAIRQSPLYSSLPKDISVTAYVNGDIYLVVTNFGDKPRKVPFARELEDLESGKSAREFTVEERNFRLLRFRPDRLPTAPPICK